MTTNMHTASATPNFAPPLVRAVSQPVVLRGGDGPSPENGVSGSQATQIPSNVYSDIAAQLRALNKNISRNTAAFASRRQDIAAQRADVEQQTKALGGLQSNIINMQETFSTEIKQLTTSFDEGFSGLRTTLDENSRVADEQHKLLIAAFKRYLPA
ncbi:hypothetical protein PENSPDRAFT_687039 [Peniophora sp. CONT]|nr:hypothetical protein PENSPDRAFT_687039 [Peniophora sp. CONT]